MYLSRTANFAKLFFLLSVCGIITYVVLAIYTLHLSFGPVTHNHRTHQQAKRCPLPKFRKLRYDNRNLSLKYILAWMTPEFTHELSAEGRNVFIDNNCEYTNCYLTANKSLLNNVKKFDAIIFSISNLRSGSRFPKRRSLKQKYVFYSMISAKDNPICSTKADDFFNWTWTYKLHSNIPTPFIEVKDLKGNVVAPSTEVEWSDYQNYSFNYSIKIKSKAIMWYIDKCRNELPHSYAKDLQKHLKNYSLELDIYGCGHKKCPTEGCLKAIEKNYSFYLAFENYLSDDYVTKEVLKALRHDAVPIVMGEADYGQFLPPGSYIDARYESPESLAGILGEIVRNPFVYKEFFFWKNQYTINEANIKKGYCQLCALLNNKERTETHSSYEFFRQWWYTKNIQERCYPKGAEGIDDLLNYIDNPPIGDNYLP